jgi:hypothetical protein
VHFSSFARIIAKRTVHLKAFRIRVGVQSIIAGTKHVIASVQRVDGVSTQLAAAKAPVCMVYCTSMSTLFTMF